MSTASTAHKPLTYLRRPGQRAVVITLLALSLVMSSPHASLARPGSVGGAASFDSDHGNAGVEVIIPRVIPAILSVSPTASDATLVLRVTTLVTNAWFDAIAPCHPTAVGVYSRLGRRPAGESDTNSNMNVAMLPSAAALALRSNPLSSQQTRRRRLPARLSYRRRTGMKVQDVMTKAVRPVAPGDDLATAAMILWDHDCGAAPVVDEAGKVVGVITDRDICMAVATKLRSPVEITVGEVASGEVHTCWPEDELTEALRTMREGRVRRLPVVDEGGALRGILSINDLVLRAGEGEQTPGLSYREVVSTLRAISEHRTEYLGEAQAAATGGHSGAG